ncbi:peptidyl-prolyl isomerase CWC27 [Thelonectria olida]|uniref:peptidylprolyl isomerase n=1 Tax=Thelonectria olida TaxID=1576542 RepID=A0A9P8WIE2_9HYPO|nr:peptidyl-prolyl isomerase CWC27 [Thelonectria olida]
MSAIYNLEPQPTASAILHTTRGELSVELFAKQTPLTCRNFLQLALDGYYDNTIFHRLVSGFILQGGDPTGTGNGGESIYDGGAFSGDFDPWPMDQRHGRNAGPTGINFKDEFHSRLKFNRRGLLAMANESRPDTNGSQFFFTLDKAEELNGKNTMFGRIASAGDTIYNLAKMGEAEVDAATERPSYPVKIERIEILVNPFEDMKKRSRVAAQAPSKSSVPKDKKKKRKGGKQLLSFGDDEGDDDVPVFKKAKFDTRLVMDDPEEEAQQKPKEPKQKGKRKAESRPKTTPLQPDEEDKEKSTSQSRPEKDPSPPPRQRTEDLSPEPEAPKKTALEKANEEIAALKASMRRTIHTEPEKEQKKSAIELMIPETSMRGRKRRPGAVNSTATQDQKTLHMLKAFQSKLEKAPSEKDVTVSTAQDGETTNDAQGADEEASLCDLHFIANCQSCTSWDKQENEESDDEGWMSHSLSFAADRLGKDLTNRKKAEEELVVIDPREKAQTMKDEKRARRDAKQGKSGRAWDQARDQAKNAQLARAASLGGRGAK